MGNPYAPKPPGAPASPTTPAAGPHAPQPTGPVAVVDPAPAPSPDAHPSTGGPQPEGSGLPQPPAPEPADPETARRATRSVLHFGLLMLASLLTTSLALPWRMVSVLVALAALVVGVRALRRIWKAGLRGMLLVALSAGMVMTCALALTTLAVVPVWQIEMDRQACLSHAITISAQTGCEADYTTAIKEYQDSLGR